MEGPGVDSTAAADPMGCPLLGSAHPASGTSDATTAARQPQERFARETETRECKILHATMLPSLRMVSPVVVG
jgi:hypothetical protein